MISASQKPWLGFLYGTGEKQKMDEFLLVNTADLFFF